SNLSAINGRVQSNITGANLYLINPSGIVFGPNATVNVSGSFHASTADYLKMSDGAKFQATNPDGSTLSAAPPVAFGFLTPRPAPNHGKRRQFGAGPGDAGTGRGPGIDRPVPNHGPRRHAQRPGRHDPRDQRRRYRRSSGRPAQYVRLYRDELWSGRN